MRLIIELRIANQSDRNCQHSAACNSECCESRIIDKLQRRCERAAEGILENDRLTAGLADEAAAAFIDWALSWAGVIVIATAGMPDSEAGQLLSPRLKANRRLMRYVNLWATGD
jgi:hypothetical protein